MIRHFGVTHKKPLNLSPSFSSPSFSLSFYLRTFFETLFLILFMYNCNLNAYLNVNRLFFFHPEKKKIWNLRWTFIWFFRIYGYSVSIHSEHYYQSINSTQPNHLQNWQCIQTCYSRKTDKNESNECVLSTHQNFILSRCVWIGLWTVHQIVYSCVIADNIWWVLRWFSSFCQSI